MMHIFGISSVSKRSDSERETKDELPSEEQGPFHQTNTFLNELLLVHDLSLCGHFVGGDEEISCCRHGILRALDVGELQHIFDMLDDVFQMWPHGNPERIV